MVGKLSYDVFKGYVAEHIQEFLPEDYSDAQVQVEEVKKINRNVTGIVVRKTEESAAPVVYLEYFYSRYIDGADLSQVLQEIAKVITDNPAFAIDMEKFMNADFIVNSQENSMRL